VTLALALRFSLRTFAFRFVFDPRLASAMTITTRPMPMMSTAASPPSIHQIAFDFFRTGAGAGVGVHCGGGGAGGGVGGPWRWWLCRSGSDDGRFRMIDLRRRRFRRVPRRGVSDSRVWIDSRRSVG
jgi:hypothetical protein